MRSLIALAALVFFGCAESVVEGGAPLPDAPATTLLVTHPTDGALLGGSRVLVSGQVTGTSSTMVTINGIPAPAEGGVFAIWVDVSEGPNVLNIVHPDSGSTISVSVTMDTLPPILDIDAPARGTKLVGASSASVTISATDENQLARVEVAGQALDPAAGPSWTVQVPLDPGVTTIKVEAEDTLGNLASEHINIMTGTYGAADGSDVLADAVVIHLGPLAIAAFNQVAGALADGLDYTALAQAQNPIVDKPTSVVTVESVAIQPGTVVSLVAEEGVITLSLDVSGFVANTNVLVPALGLDWDITLSVQEITVVVPLAVSTVDGEFQAELLAPVFDFVGTEASFSDTGGGAPDSAIIDGPVLESLEKLLTTTVLDQGVGLVDAALKKLTAPLTRTIAGFDLTVLLTAIGADVGKHGLELRLSGTLEVAGEPLFGPEDDPGPLRTPSTAKYTPRSPLATLALSDDLVNAAAHAVWRVGGLTQVVDAALLAKLESNSLAAGFLVGLTDPVGLNVDPEAPLTVTFQGPLPPVIRAIDGTDAIGAVLGDIALQFQIGEQPPVGGFVTAAFSGVAFTDEDRIRLELDSSRSAFDLDVGDPALERQVEASFEPVVKHLLSELGPLFDALLGSLPVPRIGAFRPANVTLSADGTHGQYVVLRGSLVPDGGP